MKPTRPTTLRTRAARAFSLVEVLIAVLVLSLGLLGLGAVFPMVMREQRLATETNLGISAGNAIEQMLFSRPDFARTGGAGWEAMREYLINNNGRSGEWIPIEPDDSNADQLNTYIFTHPDSGAEYHIPLAQRLYPVPYSTDQEPRFVWDMAARLLDTSSGGIDSSPILVAIFLRPIDPGIRPAVASDGRPYS
ncbi:MAG: prepilin-type N-terminal cleavage/methylation domain-containing protein, partial [Phycisphaerales bacterium JB041]